MSPIKITAILGSVLLSLMSYISSPAFSAPVSTIENPEELYHQTWQLVRDKYYDSHYAGKDWSTWEHKYDGKLATTQQAQQAITSMLGQLGDPYTKYLSPDDAHKEKELMTNSRMVGIGILLEPSNKDKSHLFITDTIDGSPALRAGVTTGDELIAINGEPVANLTPEQCGQRISGEENTSVDLSLKGSSGELRTLKVQREHLVLHPVSLKEMEGNIGYIKLSSFLYGDATAEFERALISMANKDGLILDLRHNPGGQTFNALEIADMLLEQGVIVRTVDRKGSASDVAQGRPLTRQPLVVLVDQDSASASEILAAALKDHERGEIIGTRTYGKGLVQEIEPLPGGSALHLTVAQFMSPNGAQINHVGVTPEIEVNSPEEQLKVAVDVLKSKIASVPQLRRAASRNLGHNDLVKKRA